MGNQLILILIAIVAGVAITLQAQFMGVMDKQIGTMESVFITYGSGGLLIGIAMLLHKGGGLSAWHTVPWYVLSTGILGLIIVAGIGYTTPRFGLVAAISIIVAAQFIAAAFMDHFGILGAELRSLNLTRISGMLIICFGVWLVIR